MLDLVGIDEKRGVIDSRELYHVDSLCPEASSKNYLAAEIESRGNFEGELRRISAP